MFSSGPLPPFKESELECLGHKIPWPEQVDPKHMIAAGWWKIVYDGDSTYVWTFDNDFSGPYNEKYFLLIIISS